MLFSKGSVRVKTSFTQIYRDLGCWNSIKVPENIIPSTGYYAKAAFSENDSITLLTYWTQFIQKLPNMYRVTVQEKLKHTKPGRHQEPLEYLSYEPDKALCIYKHLSEYIERTKLLQDCSKLLISYIRPHKAVSKDTVAHWLKVTLGLSGIDTEKFTAHSYRAASTLSNTAAGLSLTEILKTGWSNAQTFVKYYNKPLESVNYGSKLLERSEI